MIHGRHHRRRFLAASLLTTLAGRALRARADDDAECAAVQALLHKAGVDRVACKARANYLAIGDAPAAFIEAALKLCDGLQHDFLSHFEAKGFAVSTPKRRLTLVVLSGPEAYARYLNVAPDEAVGGHYDLQTNRLVLFDNRQRADAGPLAARANTVSLMHEATHQLCFNTGLLDRDADVPLAISEGLGVYGEVRSVDGRSRIGRRNTERLADLDAARREPGVVPGLSALIADDTLFEKAETQRAAYARSWLLVYHLMRSATRLPQFRGYLEAIRARRDASRRLDDARAAFGDLDRLDRELKA